MDKPTFQVFYDCDKAEKPPEDLKTYSQEKSTLIKLNSFI